MILTLMLPAYMNSYYTQWLYSIEKSELESLIIIDNVLGYIKFFQIHANSFGIVSNFKIIEQ